MSDVLHEQKDIDEEFEEDIEDEPEDDEPDELDEDDEEPYFLGDKNDD